MTALQTRPDTAVPPPARRGGGGRRERIGRLERILLLAGLALVALHLLDLAFSGPDTSILGVLGIVAAAGAWGYGQRHVTRPTRAGLGIVVGALALIFGTISHGFHVVNSGPDWTDVTGVGFAIGGALLIVSGLLAVAAPRRAPRRTAPGWRAAHGAGWLAGAAAFALLAVMPLVMAFMTSHAPRWEIQETSLGIPHEEVRIATADGRELSAWYVPSRNRAAVLVAHGSGGSRERVLEEIRMLARNGYGVLAYDNPGNGESEGHSNGLGDNAQPAVDAALGYVLRRPDVDPEKIAGFGSSLGGEIMVHAGAREPRLRAVISDGAARPMDARRSGEQSQLQKFVAGTLMQQAVRGISGMKESPSLLPLVERIAPRPVLLIAGGAVDEEVAVNRGYQKAGGSTAELWVVPGTGHTAGATKHPAEYERRITAFLDRALEVR